MTQRIRVGIIGAGNCARALLEGIAWYRANPPGPAAGGPWGVMHPDIGGWGPGDIEPVAAWDVDAAKVGKDLWSAREAGRNLPVGITGDLEPVGQDVIVERGPTMDGAGARYLERIDLAPDWPSQDGREIIESIRETRCDMLVNYLPVGAQEASEWWAETALRAGVSFVNCIPVFIARTDHWRQRYAAAGLVLLGDDIKSQLGATYLHRAIARAFSDRGVRLDRTYQLNVGGNMDFVNLSEQGRLGSKRESKTAAVLDAYDGVIAPGDVHIGPSDYVPWLGDTKKAFIRCEGRGYAGAPVELEAQLTVADSPNSAGVVTDAVRCAKLAAGRLDWTVADFVSAWLFKAPPRHVALLDDTQARHLMDRWLNRKASA